MKTVSLTDGSLTFSLPESLDEVTLAQILDLAKDVSSRSLIATLSGRDQSELGALSAPDLNDLVRSQLPFMAAIPDFSQMEVPKYLLINNTLVEAETQIGVQTNMFQKWDADALLKGITDEEYSRFDIIPTLLAIYLYPQITGKPYRGLEKALAYVPAILASPCTQSMPYADFIFERMAAPVPANRLTIHVHHVPERGLDVWGWLFWLSPSAYTFLKRRVA